MTWRRSAQERCSALEEAGLLRSITDFDALGPRGRLPDGRRVVSFASNDYLGLSCHPAVMAAARNAIERWGSGAGAARLVVGARPVHSELEAEIARWKATERALLFPTGYAANLGVLTALARPGTLICSDELNHASIVDGCSAAKAHVAVYPHRDPAALEHLLCGARNAIVVTDAVFSMDGDSAPIEDIAEVCARHEALLVLDEAHALLSEEPDLQGVEVLRVGTLSKFLGSAGGFVAGPGPLIELLLNRARSGIFTTALSPADAAAALCALRIVRADEGEQLKERLRSLVGRFRPGHSSPIVPLVLGDERRALEASHALLEGGFLVPAIRPPSVPAGTARLRVTLSAAHAEDEVDGLRRAVASLEPLAARA
ncbi:8-amino-7-oxononanoate synthase [soil metagenome]